jgi:hypothetical protein
LGIADGFLVAARFFTAATSWDGVSAVVIARISSSIFPLSVVSGQWLRRERQPKGQ